MSDEPKVDAAGAPKPDPHELSDQDLEQVAGGSKGTAASYSGVAEHSKTADKAATAVDDYIRG